MRLVAAFLLFKALAFGQEGELSKCPTISVTGPAGIVQPGNQFVFSGDLEGTIPKYLTYVWEVSVGKITNGQGTLRISVAPDWRSDVGKTMVATLKVVGLPEGCPNSDYGSAAVLDEPRVVLFDEFGKRPTADIEVRFRKFVAELVSNPKDYGYIVNYGTDKQIAARERLFTTLIAFRNFDRSRITLVRGGANENGSVYTKFYVAPPGAKNPAP